MEDLSKVEQKIIAYLSQLPTNQFHEINSSVIGGLNTEIDDALLSLETKEMIEISTSPTFLDLSDNSNTESPKARLIIS